MTRIAGAPVWGRALKSKWLRVDLSVAAFVLALNAVATVVAHAADTVVKDRPPLPLIWWVAPVGSVVALLFAYVFFRSVVSRDEGTPEMIEIAQAVREGAMAYLKRQYKVVAVIFAVLFVIFLIMAFGMKAQNTVVPFAFLTGGLFSGLCGFFGMKTATQASARTTHAARSSLNAGLQVAFRAGAVMGLVVVGFALLDITGWFLALYYLFPASFFSGNPLPQITVIMLSFGMGASTQALFARVGGGIYTKAADVGADIVGKVEAGLPEDDPRNAATIADNVGDNVGDVAGMGADLYESYAGSILATAALGVAAVSVQARKTPEFLQIDGVAISEMAMQLKYLAAPMVLAGIGIFLSILGVYVVRANENATMRSLLNALSRSVNLSSIAIAAAAIGVLHMLEIPNMWNVWGAIVVGLVSGIIIGKATEYYTSHEYKPTQKLSEQALTGAGTTIIDGIAVGMMSTGIPVVTIVIAIILSYYLPGGGQSPLLGLYGIGIAAVGMLSTLGLTLATDAYGPIADNAGGNAEMSGLPPEVRQRTDQLDALGNTTAATGKGFAIGSAALTAMALLAAYIEEIRFGLMHLAHMTDLSIDALDANLQPIKVDVPIEQATIAHFMDYYDVTLMNPNVLVGLFMGSVMAFFFCALTMKAVGRAAGAMVDEVRRQIREIPGIMEGETKPDYARCVEISTVGAQREMVVPSLLAIAAPIVVGILFSVPGVLGLLAGGLAAGFVLAVMMANAGGAWDNAKKYIEEGHHGGKGSEAHKAAVVGDTVGDPFKDTSGPSLNILIKLMAMVSIVFAGFIAKYAGTSGILENILGG